MRIELIVFGLIAIIVVVASLTITIPQQAQTNSSLPNFGPAPEIAQGNWINLPPLKISDLRGKVVLVDFWTYTCINCIRTLPYLNSWHEKYSSKGLVIMGVHTPEFEFEKDYNNVKAAVDKYGIKYAVVQDNNYATWNSYGNKYWPRKYLIDKEGNIRYDHIGEGGYEETEKIIQDLLGLKSDMTNISSVTNFTEIGTPEIYLGYQYARTPLGNREGFLPGDVVNYETPNITQINIIYLSGQWKNDPDRVVSYGISRLFLAYKAKNVNIVAGGNSTINVLVDGNPANGQDIKDGAGKISSQRLYNIVQGNNYQPHALEIDAEPGFELYTFTFG